MRTDSKAAQPLNMESGTASSEPGSSTEARAAQPWKTPSEPCQ